MPYYYLPHTDGKRIWLRRSKRLRPVREPRHENIVADVPSEPREATEAVEALPTPEDAD